MARKQPQIKATLRWDPHTSAWYLHLIHTRHLQPEARTKAWQAALTFQDTTNGLNPQPAQHTERSQPRH